MNFHVNESDRCRVLLAEIPCNDSSVTSRDGSDIDVDYCPSSCGIISL